MRIALVAPLVAAIREPQRGGSQAFVSDLARGLIRRGHDVHLYAASGSDVSGVPVIDAGVDPEALSATLYRASGGSVPRPDAAADAFARVYSAVREDRYDLVHNHAFDPPAISLAASLDERIVHTLHLPPDQAVAAALGEAIRGEAPPVVAGVSDFQASAWRQIVPVDAILSPLVPTGAVDWSPAAVGGAVFAGRLSPEKGAAEAIDIARAAGVEIDVYGDAYDADYALERIEPRRREPGINVHPAVARSSLWEVMARAAVVLCPARWDEPFGMVAAEAQACGTPVVAFNRGALVEVIADELTGFLVPADDLESATEAVGMAGELSRAECRAHAERRLDLELGLDAHERLYHQVVSAGTEAGARG